METTYDCVSGGGGSASPVLGHRLSADGVRSVLVRDGARSDYPWGAFIQRLAAPAAPGGTPLHDRHYTSAPEPHMPGRRIEHAHGKVLKGSNSINGMNFQREKPGHCTAELSEHVGHG